ncbi:MAG: hypothetical protein IJA80_04045 [Clostridia bacterium]|nr:hypothetical protein [Clostridia bacterium]
MKKLFSVKLYRSYRYKVFQVLILLFSLLCVLYGLGFILINLFNDVSFYEMFYERYADSFLFEDVYFFAGTMDLIELIINILFYSVLVIVSFMSLVNNKIVVYNDYIKICFAPRYLNMVINTKNITEISAVEPEEISISQKVLNFNFSKKYLYKIVTKHQQCIIVSCFDEANLNKLKELVKSNFSEEI